MKKYVRPTIETVELRPEERLANSGCVRRNQGNACTIRENTPFRN
jgi:hypothetical protein